MSHYTTARTAFRDADVLVKALADVGFKNVEVHAAATGLRGYQGDLRADLAHVIIRRKYVGRASNDIGFRRESDETLTAIISEYDRTKYSVAWLGRLRQRYAYHLTLEQLNSQGFERVEESKAPNQGISLVFRRISG